MKGVDECQLAEHLQTGSNKNKRTKTTDNRKEIRKLALYYLDELKKLDRQTNHHHRVCITEE